MKRFWRRFIRWHNLLSLAFVVFLVFVALGAPLLQPPANPADPEDFRWVEGRLEEYPLPPGPDAPLGTVPYYKQGLDGIFLLHYDVLYSLVWGTRGVLRFGVLAALCTAGVGVLIGALSGYVGGMFSRTVMRLADAFLAFPLIAGVWLFRMVMQSSALVDLYVYYGFDASTPMTPFQKIVLDLGLDPLMLALIAFAWVPYARIINALVLKTKEAEYVAAARSVGAGHARLIFRHILPNVISPAIVLAARDIGNFVVLQAAFAFIGVLGEVTSRGIPEWDRLLILGRQWVMGAGGNPLAYWWVYVPVTLALIAFGVAWNVLGDGLNAALNPREQVRYG